MRSMRGAGRTDRLKTTCRRRIRLFLFSLIICGKAAGATAADLVAAEASVFENLPTRQEAEAVCEHAASLGFGLDAEDRTLRLGDFDVNNDGVAERVARDPFPGTMGGDFFDIRSAEGERLSIESVGFEWRDYRTYGARWLPYEGRTYRLASTEESGRYLSYLSMVTPANREHIICEFATDVEERLHAAEPGYRDLCRSIERRELSSHAVEAAALRLVPGRRETSAAGEITLDFDNDGTLEDLTLLKFASGAGRGCDLEYFDLSSAVDGSTVDPAERATLLGMQRVEPHDRLPGPTCGGNVVRWLSWRGTIVLENAPRRQPPTTREQEFHTVSTIRDGNVHLACQAHFLVRHVAARYNEALR